MSEDPAHQVRRILRREGCEPGCSWSPRASTTLWLSTTDQFLRIDLGTGTAVVTKKPVFGVPADRQPLDALHQRRAAPRPLLTRAGGSHQRVGWMKSAAGLRSHWV